MRRKPNIPPLEKVNPFMLQPVKFKLKKCARFDKQLKQILWKAFIYRQLLKAEEGLFIQSINQHCKLHQNQIRDEFLWILVKRRRLLGELGFFIFIVSTKINIFTWIRWFHTITFGQTVECTGLQSMNGMSFVCWQCWLVSHRLNGIHPQKIKCINLVRYY